MECPKCHALNRPVARFCRACGARLEAPTAASPAGLHVPAAPQAATTIETAASGAPPPAAEMPLAPAAEATAQAAPAEPPPTVEPETPAIPARPPAEGGPAQAESPDAIEARPAQAGPLSAGEEAGAPTAEARPVAGTGQVALAPLPAGALIAGRFEILELLEARAEENLYLAHDLAACPVCAAVNALPEEAFCSECGVELKSAGAPVRCQLREVSSAEAVGVSPDAGVLYEGRFYPHPQPLPRETAEGPGAGVGVLSVGYASDVGMVRELDEDSLCAFTLSGVYKSVADPVLGLFIVADGMGGHEGGEVASKLAVQMIAGQLIKRLLLPSFMEKSRAQGEAVAGLLVKAIADANQEVYRLAQERNNDMGCTLTMALVINDRAHVANVGDSRTYIYGRQGLRQITTDHSLVASLIAAGAAEPEDIYTHPDRSVIYRAIGSKPTVEVDTWEEGLAPGDTLLLCCDGLWEAVRDEGIEEVLLAYPDPQAACVELVRRANLAGGEDNISVILVRVIG